MSSLSSHQWICKNLGLQSRQRGPEEEGGGGGETNMVENSHCPYNVLVSS